MYIFFGDETNYQESKTSKFFIYGGIIMPIKNLSKLSDYIDRVRKKFDYSAGDELKFDTNSRPKNISHERHIEAKKFVIKACMACECTLISYLILHKIIIKDKDKQIFWAIDTIINKFDDFLIEKKEDGICLLDTPPLKKGVNKYLSDKFQYGLNMKTVNLNLNRIRVFGVTCNNASNISSAADIILGSLRYCVNDHDNKEAATNMLKSIVPLMWKEQRGSKINVLEKGVTFRPKKISLPQYADEYKSLINKLNSLHS